MGEDFEARLAGEADREELEALLLAWGRHYPADTGWEGEARARQTADRLLDPVGAMRVLLGLRAGRPVGFAAFTVHHPARTPGGDLHLKHLFVVEGARSSGTGTRLLRALAAHALAEGCGRVEWTAGNQNERAIALYDRLGVPRAEHIVVYRLGDDTLAAFAAGGHALADETTS